MRSVGDVELDGCCAQENLGMVNGLSACTRGGYQNTGAHQEVTASLNLAPSGYIYHVTESCVLLQSSIHVGHW